MKVAIDASVLGPTGIGNYTKKLIDQLPKLFPDDQFLPLYSSGPVQRDSFRSKYLNGMKRIAVEQIVLPQQLNKTGADIFHTPKNFGVPAVAPCPSIVTIHDLIPLVFPSVYLSSFVERCYYQTQIKIAASRTAKIITDSKFSRHEIIFRLGIPSHKVEVVYLGCGEEFRIIKEQDMIPDVLAKYGVTGSFIVTIGGSEYRKNIARLVKIFQAKPISGYQLVVIGGAWRGYDLGQRFPGHPQVVFFGPVSREELITVYNGAELFVFPSLYEGFGLPVLEAMACGTPVAASNLSSIPEIAGGAAELFDPLDEEGIYEAIKKVLESKMRREDLIGRGLDRVKHFRWEETLKQTMEIYRHVLKAV